LEVLSAFLIGRKPNVPTYSQCMECKRAGTVCVIVAQGVSCLGPVTQAGCGNLCPAHNRGCYGCFGPKETPNTTSLSQHFAGLGMTSREIKHCYRLFNANAAAFRAESLHHE
jgi:coenzyme F420-reducing hydrogenase gamma subunit